MPTSSIRLVTPTNVSHNSTSSSPLSSVVVSFASYDEESETHSALQLSEKSKSVSREPSAEDDQASRMASPLLVSPDGSSNSIFEDDTISVRRGEEFHLEQRTNVQSSDFSNSNAAFPKACSASAAETMSTNNECQEEDSRPGERREPERGHDLTVRTATEEPSNKSFVPECAEEQCSVPKSADERNPPTSANSGTSLQRRPEQCDGRPLQHPSSNEEIKREIIQSYHDCGLEPNVVFTPVKAPHDPTSITMIGAWRKARLDPQTMEKLRTCRENILENWVTSGDGSTAMERRDIDLMRQLCASPMIDANATGVLSAMDKLCRQSNTTSDQMKLLDFWKLSVLAVAWQGDNHDEVDVSSDQSRGPFS